MDHKFDLNLFRVHYRKGYLWKHPWKAIMHFFRAAKHFYQRGRYGFSQVDSWEWYEWWTAVGANALRYIAEHGECYPIRSDHRKWKNLETWHAYLNKIADDLEWSAHSCGVGCHSKEENEYKDAHDKFLYKNIFAEPYVYTSPTEEEEEIHKKYWEIEEKLSSEDKVKRAAIFKEIGENLGEFWD